MAAARHVVPTGSARGAGAEQSAPRAAVVILSKDRHPDEKGSSGASRAAFSPIGANTSFSEGTRHNRLHEKASLVKSRCHASSGRRGENAANCSYPLALPQYSRVPDPPLTRRRFLRAGRRRAARGVARPRRSRRARRRRRTRRGSRIRRPA